MSIIIVSGPIGAGKTSAVKELESLIPGPVASIEGDVFWKFIVKLDQPVENEPFIKFKNVMTSMLAAALPLAKAKYTVIIDFSIPPWFVPAALKMVQAKDYALHYIMLLPSKELCIHRAATRAVGRIEYNAQQHEFYTFFENAKSDYPVLEMNELTTSVTCANTINDLYMNNKLIVK